MRIGRDNRKKKSTTKKVIKILKQKWRIMVLLRKNKARMRKVPQT